MATKSVTTKTIKFGTKILKCDCSHTFQDETYAKNNRVHNLRGKGHEGESTCTVCGKIKK